MRKKLMALLMSAVICFGGSMTAMAAPSSSVDNSMSGSSAVVDGKTYEVEIKFFNDMGEKPPKLQEVLHELYDLPDGLTQKEKNERVAVKLADLFKKETGQSVVVNNFGMMDLTIPGLDADTLAKGANITFAAYGITASDKVLVLHLKADGTWESIPATAGDGVITGTFTSLSPIFYASVTDAAVAPASSSDNNYSPEYYESLKAVNNTAQTADTSATSPKTGESAIPFIIVVVAVAAAGGVAVCVRRRYQAAK